MRAAMMRLVLAAVVLVVFLQGSSAYFPRRPSNSRQTRPPRPTPPPRPPTDPRDPRDETAGPDSLWWMDKQRNDDNNNNPSSHGAPDINGNGPDPNFHIQTSQPDHTSGKKLRGGQHNRGPSRRPSGRPGIRRPPVPPTPVDPPVDGGEGVEEWGVESRPPVGNGRRNERRPAPGNPRRPSRRPARRPARRPTGRPGDRRPPAPPTPVDPPVDGGEGVEEWGVESQPPVGNGRRNERRPAPGNPRRPSRRPARRPTGRPGDRRPPTPPPTLVDIPFNVDDEEWGVYPLPDDVSGNQPPVGNVRVPPNRRPTGSPERRQPPQDNGGQGDEGWDGQTSGPFEGNDNQPSDGRRPPGNRRPGRRPTSRPRPSRQGGPRKPSENNRGNDRFGGVKPSRGNPYARPSNNNNNNNHNSNDDINNNNGANNNIHNSNDVSPTDPCTQLAEEGSCMFYKHPQCFQEFLTGCRPYPFQADIVCTRSELSIEFNDKGKEYAQAFRQCTIGELTGVDSCTDANSAIEKGLASSECIFQNGRFCELVKDPQNCLALFHVFGFSETGELQDVLFESFNNFVAQCPSDARQSFIDNFSSKFLSNEPTTTPMMRMGAGGD